VGGHVPLLGISSNNSGFFPMGMIGDKTRFFRRTNVSRPVREWYV